jgi:hypothetical protein
VTTSSREIRKLTAIARAERRLQHRLADIDWELDVLTPAVGRVKKLEANGIQAGFELEEGKSVLDQV